MANPSAKIPKYLEIYYQNLLNRIQNFQNKNTIEASDLHIAHILLQELHNLAASEDLHLMITGSTNKTTLLTYLLNFQPNYQNYLHQQFTDSTSIPLIVSKQAKLTNLAKWQIYMQPFSVDGTSSTLSKGEILNKMLYHDSAYFMDASMIANNEMEIYLKFIAFLNDHHGFNDSKKIMIIKNLDQMSIQNQKILANEIEKGNNNVIFWFSAKSTHKIHNKLLHSVCNIRIPVLNYEDFKKLPFWNPLANGVSALFKKEMERLLNKLYQIYQNNDYQIELFLLQVSYNFSLKLSIDSIETESILQKIIQSFIKKNCKLTSILKLEDIKKFLASLVALNISESQIVIIITNYLITCSIPENKKGQIISLASHISHDLALNDKTLIVLEKFLYQTIEILFT